MTKPITASFGSSLHELHNTIPPKGFQLIRRYGLYSSRIKGAWESMPHGAERAPAGISGPLGVLRKELTVSGPAKNETVTKRLDYMEAKVEEISTVVKNLNNLIHEKEIRKVPIPLLPLVEQVAADYSGQNKAVHFSISMRKDDAVAGDSGILRQMIENLVSNAVAAVESGGKVAVRFETTDTGSRIVVEDNGRGMGPEEAVRAGNPFFTTKEASGGSGEGLFLVKRFAASLGWEVAIDSREDEGTKVTLLLPPTG